MIAKRKNKINKPSKKKRRRPKKPDLSLFTDQERRIYFMKRDAEKYALIRFEIEQYSSPPCYELHLINTKDDSQRFIQFGNVISCECSDFIYRCNSSSLCFKHILYVVNKILKMDLESLSLKRYKLYDQIKDELKINMIKFKFGGIKTILKKEKNLTTKDLCAICFSDFLNDLSNKIACPKCSGLVHIDCMKSYIKMGDHPCCIFCKDSLIVEFMEHNKANEKQYLFFL